MILELHHSLIALGHGLPFALPFVGLTGPPSTNPSSEPTPGGADLAAVMIVGPDASPITPVQPADLDPLALDQSLQDLIAAVALDTSAQAILAAIQAQPQASTKANQATFNMSALGGYTDAPVPLGTLTKITRVKVSSITGAPTGLMLKLGADTEAPLDLDANSDWTGLDASALFFSGNQTAASVVTLQLWGR